MTVLFTDMVGSTELATRLSADDADALRRQHFSTLRAAVDAAGGTEVKNLGDGVMVVFPASSSAIQCAVAMQQGVDENNRHRDEQVGLRVGMSAGEVTFEDGDYFGDPVIEAARLCATCTSGQILAAAIVKLTAGRRSPAPATSVGELELKGLPDPVDTVEFRWEPRSGDRGGSYGIPLPNRLVARPDFGLVGRAAEVSNALDAYKRTAAGDGREVVLLAGEAGLGKTTIVSEVARSASEAGACVLFGHCEEDLASPYRMIGEALTHFAEHAASDDAATCVTAVGPALARIAPGFRHGSPPGPGSAPVRVAGDSDSERYQLFAAVVDLLTLISERQPVVLVLDDLQWADKASLQLLRHVLATTKPMRLLVLGTYRSDELSNAHPLVETLAALHRMEGVHRIKLDGLGDQGVVALMEAAAGHDLDTDAIQLAHAVSRETDGNPFFVIELLRHLTDVGSIHQNAAGRWVAPGGLESISLPDSIREIIGTRVGRLGADAERVLAMAAVLGRDFDLDVLAAATERGEDGLIDILEAAEGAALVREVPDGRGQYRFAHALIQRTLYVDQSASRRARAHHRVAQALENLQDSGRHDRLGELARHWFHAIEPVDVRKSIDYSRQAADAALAALAPDDAITYYSQAIRLAVDIDDPGLELDLGIGLGTAQRQAGDPASRQTLLDACRRAAELGETDRLVAGAIENNRGWSSSVGQRDADKIEILEIALDRVAADAPERMFLLATLCGELAWGTTFERRRLLADEAVDAAYRTGDDETIVRVLNDIALALSVPQLLEVSLERTADALERAERLGDPVLLFFAAMWRAQTVAAAGELRECDRFIDLAGTKAAELDQPTLNWSDTINLTVRAMADGDPDRIEALATTALDIGTESGQPDSGVYFAVAMKISNWQRGTLGDLIPLIEDTGDHMPELPWAINSTMALAHAESGDRAAAIERLEQLAAAEYDVPLYQGWLATYCDYTDVVVEFGASDHATPIYEVLHPWSALFACTGTSVTGPVAHYLGGLATALGRFDEADEHFARAAAFSDSMRTPFFGARTDLWWGRMLASREDPGDAVRARERLDRARVIAAEHGYGVVERRAVTALDSLS